VRAERQAVFLAEGEPAPYAGVLLPEETLLDLYRRARRLEVMLESPPTE